MCREPQGRPPLPIIHSSGAETLSSLALSGQDLPPFFIASTQNKQIIVQRRIS